MSLLLKGYAGAQLKIASNAIANICRFNSSLYGCGESIFGTL